MNNQELKDKIIQIVPEAECLESKQFLNVTVPKEKFFELAKFLKEKEDIQFDFLFNVTGIDEIDKLIVTYHLRSTKCQHDVVLKTFTKDRDNPLIDSVTSLWKTADFLEREVYDFFGIKFNNHPDMRRLFLDETRIEGFPFRKDYVDEINIVER